MQNESRRSHPRASQPVAETTGGPVISIAQGRPHVGQRVKAHVPPWVHRQVDALRAGPWGAESRAGVVRDLVIVGLLALKAKGVQAPGFDPEAAIREAVLKGEPTATALDVTRRARARAERSKAQGGRAAGRRDDQAQTDRVGEEEEREPTRAAGGRDS